MYHILDAQNIIMSGIFSPTSKNWNVNGYPTGGLYKLYGYIMRAQREVERSGNGAVIITFEGGNLLRKELYPDYKANRKGRFDEIESEIIETQMLTAERQLRDAGFIVIKEPTYEADDIIYTIAAILSNIDKNAGVVIYSDDNDLNDFRLFVPNTELRSVSGHKAKRNTGVVLNGILYGVQSDNVRGITNKPLRKHFRELYLEGKYSPFVQGDVNEIREYLKQYKLDSVDEDEMVKNTYLVRPMIVNLTADRFKSNIDKSKISTYFNALGFRKYLKVHLGETLDYSNPQVLDEIKYLLSSTTQEMKREMQIREAGENENLDAYSNAMKKPKAKVKQKRSGLTQTSIEEIEDNKEKKKILNENQSNLGETVDMEWLKPSGKTIVARKESEKPLEDDLDIMIKSLSENLEK